MSKIYEPHKSSLGLNANLLATLIYIIPIILSIVWPSLTTVVAIGIAVLLLVLERDSGLVKYHACLSLIILAITFVFAMVIGVVGAFLIGDQVINGSITGAVQGFGVLFYISMGFSILVTVLNVIAAVKSIMWTSVRFPLIGKWAATLSKEQK